MSADSKAEVVEVNGISFTHHDVHVVVEDFYRKVAIDDELSVPFRSVHDWPEHVERLTHFWWIRFGGKPYMMTHYNPVLKHFYAGFNEELLKRWIFLFKQTLQNKLTPEQTQIWGTLVDKMGASLLIRNDLLKAQEGNS